MSAKAGAAVAFATSAVLMFLLAVPLMGLDAWGWWGMKPTTGHFGAFALVAAVLTISLLVMAVGHVMEVRILSLLSMFTASLYAFAYSKYASIGATDYLLVVSLAMLCTMFLCTYTFVADAIGVEADTEPEPSPVGPEQLLHVGAPQWADDQIIAKYTLEERQARLGGQD